MAETVGVGRRRALEQNNRPRHKLGGWAGLQLLVPQTIPPPYRLRLCSIQGCGQHGLLLYE